MSSSLNTSVIVDAATHPSLFDLTYTYHYDKYSCISYFYQIHVVMSFIIMFAGFGCFITRVWDRIKWMHVWFGRLYILAMLYSTASSLLIHNTGLPLGSLVSFIHVMIGLGFGWFVIGLHQQNVKKAALERLQQRLLAQGGTLEPSQTIPELLAEETAAHVNSKTFLQRVLSLKMMHGLSMVISWVNISGRIPASRFTNNYTCHTYPVYKPGYNVEKGYEQQWPFTLVPTSDPVYTRTPWANSELRWYLIMGAFPLVVGLAVGITWAYFAARRQERLRLAEEEAKAAAKL
ncbi:hypothetical protein HDV05_003825 [Chytridiales sp. JEL 0842]|nr:hypothetical protein HDV05_003825 [Chytridiales sp. JEL 0842]